MIKKSVIAIIITSLLIQIGCSITSRVTRSEVEDQHLSGDLEELIVITNENAKYSFPPWGFTINNDTITGKGYKIWHDIKEPFDGKIAMSEVREFQTKSVHAGATAGLIIVGVVVAGIAILALVYASLNSILD